MREESYTIKHTSQVIYLTLPSGDKAYLKYSVEGGVMKLIETYTPLEFRGKGIAAMLVNYAVDLARRNNWLIEPVCSYSIYYFMKNKDLREILVENYKNLSDEEWRRLFENAKIREKAKS